MYPIYPNLMPLSPGEQGALFDKLIPNNAMFIRPLCSKIDFLG